MSKTHDEFKGLVKVSEASEKRSKRGMMSKVLDPAGMHTDTTQPVIKGSGFKMTGFPQHSGVSPVKQVLKEKDHFLVKKQRGPVEKTTYVRPDTKSIGPKNRIKTKTKTKVQKFLDKHPKINDGLDKVKNVATKTWDKANAFAKSDAGKAILAGVADKATTPRPRKEVVAIIQGEQKSIM